jgi:hypothetical protein
MALLRGNAVNPFLVYTEREIRNIFFKSSRLEKTCLAATKLNKLIGQKRYKAVEVHPTSKDHRNHAV